MADKNNGGNDRNKPYRTEEAPVDGRHPAYGVVRLSRISGAASLFGSPLETGQYVRLEICEAEEMDSHGGTKSIHPRHGSVVTVDLSEAQYASMLTSMGMYNGTPCTITRREGKAVPTIPYQSGSARAQEMAQKLKDKLADTSRNLETALSDLSLGVENGKGKTVMREILQELRQVARDLNAGIPDLGEVFERDMQEVVETAKTEVNAYAASVSEGLRQQANAIGAPAPQFGLLSGPAADGAE